MWKRILLVTVLSLGLPALLSHQVHAESTLNALSDNCHVSLCVTVDSSKVLESASHQAAGLLHSMDGSSIDTSRLAPLGVTMWRSSNYDWNGSSAPWNGAATEHIPVTFVLSDKWISDTKGGEITPWSNWARYSQWVVSSVRQIEAAGIRVDYWEVYNEPDGDYPYGLLATATPARLLEQFLTAYRAIRSVLPDAQVIGPSLSEWRDRPNSHAFSVRQFIDFAASQNIRLAALSWHYNRPEPAGIESQVAAARSMLSAQPTLGQPKIFINEFGIEASQRIPGWDVQYLAALTDARVDSAGRSCWQRDCASPVFDGLLSSDGSSTLPDYWVRAFYAQMTGDMVATSTNSEHAGALASLDQRGSQLRVLVAYGKGCIQDARCLTSAPWAVPALPVETQVSIRVPWQSGHVAVRASRIEGTSISPIGHPAPVSIGELPIVDVSGVPTVTIAIDPMEDGDAWTLILDHTG